jgi:hypothetical protein
MRCKWVWIIGAGACISMVPACSPLLRQPLSNELAASPPTQREEPADPAPARGTPAAPNPPTLVNDTVKPAVLETTAESARYPALVTDPDIIPPVAEPSPVATGTQPAEPSPDPESHPDNKAKPAEELPLLEALRCLLNQQPAEAVGSLARYDKRSQELLLCLLPLAVRLSEGSWERLDPREANNAVQQLDRMTEVVAAPLRCRAPLSIKKMCLCEEKGMEGYGKYIPIPDSHGYRPGDFARVYVELQNLWDQPQGNAYSIHLVSTAVIRDLNGREGLRLRFRDTGPDISYTQRHDFYRTYTFRVPPTHPGLYILYLTITDVTTGRTATRTLDFRIIPPNGKADW